MMLVSDGNSSRTDSICTMADPSRVGNSTSLLCVTPLSSWSPHLAFADAAFFFCVREPKEGGGRSVLDDVFVVIHREFYGVESARILTFRERFQGSCAN